MDCPLPHIPDNLTIPQFVFDTTIVPRPQRPHGTPYFIEEATGREIYEDEVRSPMSYDCGLDLGPDYSRPNAEVTLLPRLYGSHGALVSSLDISVTQNLNCSTGNNDVGTHALRTIYVGVLSNDRPSLFS